MTKIIGIDPGGTTGVCVLSCPIGTRDLSVEYVGEFTWAKRFGIMPLLRSLVTSQDQPPQQLVVVVESFRLYSHRAKQQIGSDFPSVRVIGIIEAALHLADALHCIHFQPASNISRVIVLPQHVSIVGGSEHMKDAYKHARYYWEMHNGTTPVSESGSRAGASR